MWGSLDSNRKINPHIHNQKMKKNKTCRLIPGIPVICMCDEEGNLCDECKMKSDDYYGCDDDDNDINGVCHPALM